MRLGMVGLGRMGSNMVRRLSERGHELVAYDLDPDRVEQVVGEGALAADSLEDLAAKLQPPRTVWVMVPSGEPTRSTIGMLAGVLQPGDSIVDGGNSNYKEAQRTSAHLNEQGIALLDVGVSGGVWGLREGYCLMVGGDAGAVERLRPVLTDLAPQDGYAHVGPSGAGHFTKMVHNGIEYGMLQAYAEGFALLHSANELDLDLHQIAAVWNHGSVVRSWLLELAELALSKPEEFDTVKGWVEDSGEGRWTVEEAVNRAGAAPAITASLFARFSSRDEEEFSGRIVAALRKQFGGHAVVTDSPLADDVG